MQNRAPSITWQMQPVFACFFAAMLVTAHLFTEHRSMKAPSLGIIHGRMLPL